MDSKWVYFEEADSEGRITKIWTVNAKADRTYLGDVKWYAPWRQYCFYPEPFTLYNAECMSDIQKFVTWTMQDHRAGVKKRDQKMTRVSTSIK